MLISSVLRMLDRHQSQPQESASAGKARSAAEASAAKENSSLHEIEREIAAAAGLLRPIFPEHQPAPAIAAGQRLEDLLRAVTEAGKPARPRLLDVFE